MNWVPLRPVGADIGRASFFSRGAESLEVVVGRRAYPPPPLPPPPSPKPYECGAHCHASKAPARSAGGARGAGAVSLSVIRQTQHPMVSGSSAALNAKLRFFSNTRSRSRADQLRSLGANDAVRHLERVEAHVLAEAAAGTRVFHFLATSSAHAGLKEVWTLRFAAPADHELDGDQHKENRAYMDTHSASSRVVRAVVEADLGAVRATPQLLLATAHEPERAFDGEAWTLVRSNPFDKTTVLQRIDIVVAQQAEGGAPAASAGPNFVVSKAMPKMAHSKLCL